MGGEHRGQCGAGQLHHRGDIDVELVLQHGKVGGPEFPGGTQAGVIDQHPNSCRDPFGNPVAIGGQGQISRQNLDVDAVGRAQFRRQHHQAVDVAGHQNQVMAITREAAGIAFTNAGGGAGDQGDGSRHPVTLSA